MNEMPRTDHGGMQHITLAEENHQQMWDDTLMMTVLPLAKIGKLLNRPSMWKRRCISSCCTCRT
jgi:unsaturated rhamnogalacturonyl hydrolase